MRNISDDNTGIVFTFDLLAWFARIIISLKIQIPKILKCAKSL
jgi:hypothetical protein